MLNSDPELECGRRIAKYFENYGIFNQIQLTLRGTLPDSVPLTPIGLNGGRLAEAIEDMICEEDGDRMFGSMYIGRYIRAYRLGFRYFCECSVKDKGEFECPDDTAGD